MSRRVPIEGDEPQHGAHRPEVVQARVMAEQTARIEHMETRMAQMDSILSRLDTVVAAAANARNQIEAELAAQVDARVQQLEGVLGLPVNPLSDPAPVADQPQSDAPTV